MECATKRLQRFGIVCEHVKKPTSSLARRRQRESLDWLNRLRQLVDLTVSEEKMNSNEEKLDYAQQARKLSAELEAFAEQQKALQMEFLKQKIEQVENMQEEQSVEEKIWSQMMDLWQALDTAKPQDRNESARRYAVTVTEFQKVMGYFYTFVMQECSLEFRPEEKK